MRKLAFVLAVTALSAASSVRPASAGATSALKFSAVVHREGKEIRRPSLVVSLNEEGEVVTDGLRISAKATRVQAHSYEAHLNLKCDGAESSANMNFSLAAKPATIHVSSGACLWDVTVSEHSASSSAAR